MPVVFIPMPSSHEQALAAPLCELAHLVEDRDALYVVPFDECRWSNDSTAALKERGTLINNATLRLSKPNCALGVAERVDYALRQVQRHQARRTKRTPESETSVALVLPLLVLEDESVSALALLDELRVALDALRPKLRMSAAQCRYVPWVFIPRSLEAWPPQLFSGPDCLMASHCVPLLCCGDSSAEQRSFEGYGQDQLLSDGLALLELASRRSAFEQFFPRSSSDREVGLIHSSVVEYPLYRLVREATLTTLRTKNDAGLLPSRSRLEELEKALGEQAAEVQEVEALIANLKSVIDQSELEVQQFAFRASGFKNSFEGSLPFLAEELDLTYRRPRADGLHDQFMQALTERAHHGPRLFVSEAMVAAHSAIEKVRRALELELKRALESDESAPPKPEDSAFERANPLERGLARGLFWLTTSEQTIRGLTIGSDGRPPPHIEPILERAQSMRCRWLEMERLLISDSARMSHGGRMLLEVAVATLGGFGITLVLLVFSGLSLAVSCALAASLAALLATVVFLGRRRALATYAAEWERTEASIRKSAEDSLSKLVATFNERIRLIKRSAALQLGRSVAVTRNRLLAELLAFERCIVEQSMSSAVAVSSHGDSTGRFTAVLDQPLQLTLSPAELFAALRPTLLAVLTPGGVVASNLETDFQQIIDSLALKSVESWRGGNLGSSTAALRSAGQDAFNQAMKYALDFSQMPLLGQSGQRRVLLLTGELIQEELDATDLWREVIAVQTSLLEGAQVIQPCNVVPDERAVLLVLRRVNVRDAG